MGEVSNKAALFTGRRIITERARAAGALPTEQKSTDDVVAYHIKPTSPVNQFPVSYEKVTYTCKPPMQRIDERVLAIANLERMPFDLDGIIAIVKKESDNSSRAIPKLNELLETLSSCIVSLRKP